MILHDDTVIPTKPTVPVYDNKPGRNWTIPARSGWMGIDKGRRRMGSLVGLHLPGQLLRRTVKYCKQAT